MLGKAESAPYDQDKINQVTCANTLPYIIINNYTSPYKWNQMITFGSFVFFLMHFGFGRNSKFF